MRRVTTSLLLTALALSLPGCAASGPSSATPPVGGSGAAGSPGEVTLTRVGEAVQFTENAESTHECEFVTHLPVTSTSASDVNAMRALRNEAGRNGANLVLLIMGSGSTIARAEGYLCAD